MKWTRAQPLKQHSTWSCYRTHTKKVAVQSTAGPRRAVRWGNSGQQCFKDAVQCTSHSVSQIHCQRGTIVYTSVDWAPTSLSVCLYVLPCSLCIYHVPPMLKLGNLGIMDRVSCGKWRVVLRNKQKRERESERTKRKCSSKDEQYWFQLPLARKDNSCN